MITLPGVARKSANVVLNTAFNMPTGIIVDTHVSRVAPRLGLTKKEKPEEIEADLMKLVPKDDVDVLRPGDGAPRALHVRGEEAEVRGVQPGGYLREAGR
jgi:hypothetical protein